MASRGRNPDNPSDRTTGAPTEQRLEPNLDGVCNTLTTVTKDNLVLEMRSREQTHMTDNNNPVTWGGLQEHQHPRKDGISPALTAAMGIGGGQTPIFTERRNDMSDKTETQYRIRKLTPRECWRLMSFSDEDFDRAEQVNSNTQLYKQAGNSIVKNVLIAIFGQMIPGKENVYKDSEKGSNVEHEQTHNQ